MLQIARFVSQLQNALVHEARHITVPYSRNVYAICMLLINIGAISTCNVQRITVGRNQRSIITLSLLEHMNMLTLVRVQLISRPGSKRYWTKHRLVYERAQSTTLVIVSTDSGIMTSAEAIRRGIGGEALFWIELRGV